MVVSSESDSDGEGKIKRQQQASSVARLRERMAQAQERHPAGGSRVLEQNAQLKNGDWLKGVIWDDSQEATPVPLVMDLNDEDMFFNMTQAERPVLLERLPDSSQEGKTVEAREVQVKMAEDKRRRLALAARNTGFKYNAHTYTKGMAWDGRKRPVEVPAPVHSIPASDKALVKLPKLEETRLFHRPRIKEGMLTENNKWLLKRPPSRGAEGYTSHVVMRGGVHLNPMHGEKDLIPFTGHFVLMEYLEEFPPLVNNVGMASRIINWWRPTGSSGPGSGGHRRKGTGFGAGRDESGPKMSEGQNKVLSKDEESPFIAPIQSGKTVSSCCNELFRAPIAEHPTRKTDFLLIRDPIPKKDRKGTEIEHHMVIREIPRLFVVGQSEPRRAVFEPGRPDYKHFQNQYAAFLMARLFESGPAGTTGFDMQRIKEFFRYSGVNREKLKQLLKEVAQKQDPDGPGRLQRWVKRVDISVPLYKEQAASSFTPEEVCAYESCNVASRRLRDAGIMVLTAPDGVSKELRRLLERHNNLSDMVKEIRVRLRELPSKPPTKRYLSFKKVSEALEEQLADLSRVREIAQFIHEELQLVPWALTSNYVNVHLKGQSGGMLQLVGVGDPSGRRGEGFSFLMKQEEHLAAKDQLAKKAKEEIKGPLKKVSGTSGDLRKLNMRELEQQLVSLGMEAATVKDLKRWDRVHMIAQMANMAVSEGAHDAASVMRFTRKSRKSQAGERQRYLQQLQEIWARQAAAMQVTASEAEAYAEAKPAGKEDKEGDSDSDLDDLMDDLDDIEKEEEEGGGRKKKLAELMRKAPVTGVEAAERDDEKALLDLQRDLAKPGGQAHKDEAAKTMATAVANYDARASELAKSLQGRLPTKAVKRITRTVQEDGTELVKVDYIFDAREINRLQRLKEVPAKSSPLGFFIPQDGQRGETDTVKVMEDAEGEGGQVKLNLTKMQKVVAQHKEDQKRKRLHKERISSGPYKPTTKAKGRGGRGRAAQPHVRYCDILKQIVESLLNRRDSGTFQKPVNKRELPSYYQIVKSPIDLGTILSKVKNFSYRNHEAFLDDLELMASNSAQFNGPAHGITLDARAILDDGRRQVGAKRHELLDLEAKVADSPFGAKTAKKTYKKRKKAGDPAPPAFKPRPAKPEGAAAAQLGAKGAPQLGGVSAPSPRAGLLSPQPPALGAAAPVRLAAPSRPVMLSAAAGRGSLGGGADSESSGEEEVVQEGEAAGAVFL
ncbi:unnamed protein product [Chrysoparadoxa australica]